MRQHKQHQPVVRSSIRRRIRARRVPNPPYQSIRAAKDSLASLLQFFVPFSAISAPFGLEMRDAASSSQHGHRRDSPKLLVQASPGPRELISKRAGRVSPGGIRSSTGATCGHGSTAVGVQRVCRGAASCSCQACQGDRTAQVLWGCAVCAQRSNNAAGQRCTWVRAWSRNLFETPFRRLQRRPA